MASVSAYLIDEPEAPARPHVPARQVVMSAVALWLCYFALITLRGLVVELGEFQELLWRRALVTLAGIAVTLLVWPVLRRFDGRSIGLRVAASLVLMLPAVLALAVVNQKAFAPVEQRMVERMAKDDALRAVVPPPGATPSASASPTGDPATTKIIPGVRIRHDVSGNVLIDVPDPMPAPTFVVPPEPPAPPAPPVAPRDPAPVIRDRSDGSSEMLAPGGVVIRHNADGTAQIRAGSMVLQVDGEDAEGIARELKDARLQMREAEEARRAAMAPVRRSMAEAGLAVPSAAPPAAPPVEPAPPARPVPEKPRATTKPAPAAKPSEPRRIAVAPASTPSPQPAPSPVASASEAAPAHVRIIRKAVEDEGLWRQLTDVALGRYFLLIAWAALYLALGNGEMARAAERREGEYRRAAKAAELRSLRYQVNPHFLFNTLNSLSALVMVGRSEQAERMIQTISSFYRHSLASDPTSDVPLSDEIALQRHYLEIEAVRFPERLRTEFDVPDALLTACVPGMILQPLVENSIKYAVSASTRPVTIRIAAREAEGLLVLTVADDGPGKVGESGSTGIGLGNVRQRLAARFGDRASVESGALPAGGYATVLTLPVIRHAC